jgi:recombination protein RecA
MTNAQLQKKLEAEQARMEKKYGHRSAARGSVKFKESTIPSGILALDYALGTGGWPRPTMIEVYGAPDIGKSSVLGLSAIREAQKMGLVCGVVALEPRFDGDWAAKHGVDPDDLMIARPDDGLTAFNMLHDWIRGEIVDFILFDSIGAVLRPSETEPDGKPSQGGQSALITWGVKAALPLAFKRGKTVIFLNQIRDDMNSRISGIHDSPGGWALKHSCDIRIELRTGRDKQSDFTIKDSDGKENYDIQVGRELIAKIVRNKHSEGTNKRASFYFYNSESNGKFGIDRATDVIRTGLRTGVIERRGAYYNNAAFPENEKGERTIYGKDAIADFIEENPNAIPTIRQQVIEVMHAKAEKKAADEVGGDEDATEE